MAQRIKRGVIRLEARSIGEDSRVGCFDDGRADRG